MKLNFKYATLISASTHSWRSYFVIPRDFLSFERGVKVHYAPLYILGMFGTLNPLTHTTNLHVVSSVFCTL